MRIRTAAAGLTSAALVLLGASTAPAAADPKGEPFPLTCGQQTYMVVVAGNGDWTPAHSTTDTTMFIPVSFGDFTGTVTDANGAVVDQFTEPGGEAKGPGRNALMTCSFTFTETFQDPELGEGTFTFTGTGTVSGFATPRH
jgi:hypothetical protein